MTPIFPYSRLRSTPHTVILPASLNTAFLLFPKIGPSLCNSSCYWDSWNSYPIFHSKLLPTAKWPLQKTNTLIRSCNAFVDVPQLDLMIGTFSWPLRSCRIKVGVKLTVFRYLSTTHHVKRPKSDSAGLQLLGLHKHPTLPDKQATIPISLRP